MDSTPLTTNEHPEACANCGTSLQGAWCHDCGQRDIDLDRPFLALAWHAIAETFDVDGRLFHSLRLMLFKPGALGQMWMQGKRAARSSPIRLFLFIGFVAALVFTVRIRDLHNGISELYPNNVAVLDGDTLTLDFSRDNLNAQAQFERIGTFLDPAFERLAGQPVADVMTIILSGSVDAMIQVTVVAIFGLSLIWKMMLWRRPLIGHLVVTLDFVTFGYLLTLLLILLQWSLMTWLPWTSIGIYLGALAILILHIYSITGNAYGLRGWARLWRSAVVGMAILIIGPMTFTLAMIVTIGSI